MLCRPALPPPRDSSLLAGGSRKSPRLVAASSCVRRMASASVRAATRFMRPPQQRFLVKGFRLRSTGHPHLSQIPVEAGREREAQMGRHARTLGRLLGNPACHALILDHAPLPLEGIAQRNDRCLQRASRRGSSWLLWWVVSMEAQVW